MTTPRRETRTLAIRLSRVDWAWIARDLIRRHVGLNSYISQVVEGEIAFQREARAEGRTRVTHPTLPTQADQADRPVLAVER